MGAVDDAGSLGRVDIELMPDRSAVASWIEFADQRAQFRVRRLDQSGANTPALLVSGLAGGRASGYPRIVYMTISSFSHGRKPRTSAPLPGKDSIREASDVIGPLTLSVCPQYSLLSKDCGPTIQRLRNQSAGRRPPNPYQHIFPVTRARVAIHPIATGRAEVATPRES
jgi:hypothetical protein